MTTQHPGALAKQDDGTSLTGRHPPEARSSRCGIVPEGYHTVTPWMISPGNTVALIDFIVGVFDATDLGRMGVDGAIDHAEVRIGDSVVMMFDRPGWPLTPSFLRVYVADDAEVLRRAVERGAAVVTEPTELFWGDRVSRFRDPFGNLWWIHQRVAELTEEEATRRLQDPRFIKAMEYVASGMREITSPDGGL